MLPVFFTVLYVVNELDCAGYFQLARRPTFRIVQHVAIFLDSAACCQCFGQCPTLSPLLISCADSLWPGWRSGVIGKSKLKVRPGIPLHRKCPRTLSGPMAHAAGITYILYVQWELCLLTVNWELCLLCTATRSCAKCTISSSLFFALYTCPSWSWFSQKW
jgi:hypothetical protein